MVKVFVLNEFKRQMKPLVKKYKSMKSDYANFIEEITANPYIGVDLGNGVHKVRIAITSKAKGKSGGARIITYVVEHQAEDTLVHLMSIYDKSDIQSVSDSYIHSLVEQIKHSPF